MVPLLALALPIAPGIGVAVAALIAAFAAGWMLYNHVANKPSLPASTRSGGSVAFAGILGGVERLLHLHTGGEPAHRLAAAARGLARVMVEWDKKQDHRELNALMGHLVPSVVPLLPVIDKGIDVLEAKADGSLTIRPGSDLYELVKKLFEAKAQQAPSPTGKS